VLPNEGFSGSGHRDHICKECNAARRQRRRAERRDAEGQLENMPMQADRPSAGKRVKGYEN
jgi:hypothetical protein